MINAIIYRNRADDKAERFWPKRLTCAAFGIILVQIRKKGAHMSMQMGFRWYGEGNDKITLCDIRQIPGVTTIVWALHDKLPGEVWQPEEIAPVVEQI